MFLSAPDVLGWVIMAASTSLEMMMISRFLAGVAAGGYLLSIQMFVGEIVSTDERGWLLCLTTPVSSLGLLIMYSSRELLPWHCSAAASAPLSAVMSVVLLFYWDTPHYYSTINNQQFARESFRQYRGAGADLSDLETMLQHSGRKLSVVECVSDIFSSKQSFKPVLILNSLYFLTLMCGKLVIDYYAVDVFIRFGYSMSEFSAGVVAASLSFLGTLFMIIMVKHLTRKTVMVSTSSLMMLSLVFLGLCSYSHNHDIVLLSQCDWLPITCVVSYLMAVNMGHSTLPNIFLSEFYPAQAR